MKPQYPSIIVHGGAGRFPASAHNDAKDGVRNAMEGGWDILNKGGSAIDAAEAAVRILEDDRTFNAGHGSSPNADGMVEMDAIIVDGTTLRMGAVAGIRGVANSISVARLVMSKTEHCLLAGQGATRFAREHGFPEVPDEELRREPSPTPTSDTVGAVAVDHGGHCATATSTGGMKNKMPGRIGDSPLIGCGGIAEDGVGAASATGHGERIMEVMLSRTALDFLRQGYSAMEAAERAIGVLADRVRGEGGIILVDAAGNLGYAFNTPQMPHCGRDGANNAFHGI